MKPPEEIKKGLAEAPHIQYTFEDPNCIDGYSVRYAVAIGYVLRDDIAHTSSSLNPASHRSSGRTKL